MKKPKHQFKGRPLASPGEPPGAEKLLDEALLRKAIDPARAYQVQLPDGTAVTYSGESLLKTARTMGAFIEATRSGDDARIRSAIEDVMADVDRGSHES